MIVNKGEQKTIFGDKNMLHTILRNLLYNALKFTDRGGTVRVDVLSGEASTTILVTDSGVGMSQEKIAKLFDISREVSTPGTENEKGTGLGLILCKDLVEKYEGTIFCKSELGVGSVFTVEFPFRRDSDKPA